MAGYTVVNLKEVEDQAPQFGISPGLEARFARVPLEMENSGISYFRLAPNFRVPFGHKHEEQEEVCVILAGSVRIQLDDEVVELGPWDAIRVPPGYDARLRSGSRWRRVLSLRRPQHRKPRRPAGAKPVD